VLTGTLHIYLRLVLQTLVKIVIMTRITYPSQIRTNQFDWVLVKGLITRIYSYFTHTALQQAPHQFDSFGICQTNFLIPKRNERIMVDVWWKEKGTHRVCGCRWQHGRGQTCYFGYAFLLHGGAVFWSTKQLKANTLLQCMQQRKLFGFVPSFPSSSKQS